VSHNAMHPSTHKHPSESTQVVVKSRSEGGQSVSCSWEDYGGRWCRRLVCKNMQKREEPQASTYTELLEWGMEGFMGRSAGHRV